MEPETLFNIDEYNDGIIGPNDVPVWLISVEKRINFDKRKRKPEYHIAPKIFADTPKKEPEIKVSARIGKHKSKAPESFHERLKKVLKVNIN